MFYFLYGENSYHALRKITDFKNAFRKKALPARPAGAGFLVEEYDGEAEEMNFEKFHAVLGQANLFSKTRLVIFKNVLGEKEELFNELKERGEVLKNSKDIFVFWEREPVAKILTFFKRYSEKTQEVKTQSAEALDKWLDKKAQAFDLKLGKTERALMIEEAGEQGEWALEGELEKLSLSGGLPGHQALQEHSQRDGARQAIFQQKNTRVPTRPVPAASPFAFIDKMFGPRALLALKEMSLAGLEPQKFIYVFLWKLKQKKMPDTYFEGILAESQMRRDPKNAEAVLEHFISSITSRA